MSNKTLRVNNDDHHDNVKYLIAVRDNDSNGGKCLMTSFISTPER